MIKYNNNPGIKMFFIVSGLTALSHLTKRKLWSFVIGQKQVFKQPKKRHRGEVYKIDDVNIIKFNPVKPSNAYIVYFHGGGFVMSGNHAHYDFITKLSKLMQMTCYYIDYPLAPTYKSAETNERLIKILNQIQEQENQKELILLGDSAGGNLALVLSQSFKQSKNMVLLSPWLDLTMSNPKINSLEDKEIMYSKNDLLNAANDYRRNQCLTDPLLSPINAKFHDKNILMIAGSDDILYPDMVKFHQQEPSSQFHAFIGLKHDFMFLANGRERKMVYKIIQNFLEGKTHQAKELSQ